MGDADLLHQALVDAVRAALVAERDGDLAKWDPDVIELREEILRTTAPDH